MIAMADRHWRLRDPANARFERFASEGMFLNPVSWETHALREPAVSVVEALLEGPASEEALRVRVLDEEIDPQEGQQLISEALRALLALGVAVQD